MSLNQDRLKEADPADFVIFNEVSLGEEKYIGKVTLNRPMQINVLNLAMVRMLYDQLVKWRKNNNVLAIWIEGNGEKGFCAGGDVKALALSEMAHRKSMSDVNAEKDNKNSDDMKKVPCEAFLFFDYEYNLDYLSHCYPKPVIVWGNGMVLGGGLGIFIGASHRIACEDASFAMPEVLIGLYPDVGASCFLHWLPHSFGLFWGLSATRLDLYDGKYFGLLDYPLAYTSKRSVFESLIQLPWLQAASHDEMLNDFFTSFLLPLEPLKKPFQWCDVARYIEADMKYKPLKRIIEDIKNYVFLPQSVSAALNERLAAASPFSLSTTFMLWHMSRHFSLKKAFVLDKKMVRIFIRHHPDFIEGVRALLIDKDKTPKWQNCAAQFV